MDCESWQQLISLRHDGVIDRKREQQLQQHLQSCHCCRQFDEFLGKLAMEPAPVQNALDFWPQLADKLPDIPMMPAARNRLAQAAAVLLALAVGIYLYNGQRRLAGQISQMRREKNNAATTAIAFAAAST